LLAFNGVPVCSAGSRRRVRPSASARNPLCIGRKRQNVFRAKRAKCTYRLIVFNSFSTALLDKWRNIVNNVLVGREPLSFGRIKDSATHPTVLTILVLLRVSQMLLVALLFCQP